MAMRTSHNIDSVTVIGARGELGKEICALVAAADMKLYTFDKAEPASFDDIMLSANIVHWCAPLTALKTVKSMHEATILLLHDSVMHSSLQAVIALKKRLPNCKISICHWLMNDEHSVVVAKEFTDISSHVAELGLNPLRMTIKEHDTFMAYSQSPMALLHEVLLPVLSVPSNKPLLTQSASDLLAALQSRRARWTDNTLAAILKNPEIPILLDRLATVAEQNKV
jgi:hypothetical protein